MWVQGTDTNGDGIVNTNDKMSQSDGESYCSDLSLGEYKDWRLPDIKTLYSLIMFSGGDPSSYSGDDTSGLTLFLDSVLDWAFGDMDARERLIDAQYLSSSTYKYYVFSNTTCFFGVNFVDGRIKCYPNSDNDEYYVRCVRGEKYYGLNNYKDNKDETISDRATGLMWQKGDTASDNWDNAVSVCETLSLAGYADWRLPHAKELQSIVDYYRSPDTKDSAAIHPDFDATSFTNEEGITDYYWYWASTTHKTYTNDGSAGTYVTFGRALGYNDNEIQDVHGAGAQRSDRKVGSPDDFPKGHGPQGDVVRIDHHVRLVRDI